MRLRWIAPIAFCLAQAAGAAGLTYGWQNVDGHSIFYREGGPLQRPPLVLLHGNPTSSIEYRSLMEQLAAKGIHVLAMDYPSFGFSDAPPPSTYAYTFDHVAETIAKFLKARGVTRYALYMQDYGVPVGFRLIEKDPQATLGEVIQNGVIQLDGFPAAQDPGGELRRHWVARDPAVDARRAAYANAAAQPNAATWDREDGLDPDARFQAVEAYRRPGVVAARNDLWFDYGNNLPRYPLWQQLLARQRAPLTIIWGRRDDYFTLPAVAAYRRTAPRAQVHILDSTHFAATSDPDLLAPIVLNFARRAHLVSTSR